ncbi:probable cytochrome P450 6a14 [Anopheles aquasalis]|uniref:probable cytochrome P450 6a14 n=1 Tax=Anopheles aquasalis TaxID=42839 RepID=UPI00215B04B6|nr:probable cytochrome P450 6a14 [Anopheles aquasalis]
MTERWHWMRAQFWTDQGVPSASPSFPLGNIQHASHLMLDLYRELKGKGPFAGIFQFVVPVAFVTDPEMIKNVLVRHYRHFSDRGGYSNAKHEPLSGHMLNAQAHRWTVLRHAAIPAFSSGRLKAFYPVIVQLMDRLMEGLHKKLGPSEECVIECQDVVGRLSTDIIASFLLGIDGKSLSQADGGLYTRVNGKTFLIPSTWKLFFMTSCRTLARALRLKLFANDITVLFQRLVHDVIAFRGNRNEQREDLLQRFLQLSDENGKPLLKEDEVAAEVLLFFAAGYESTSVMVAYCLDQLARNPEIQERARECALEARAKHGGLNYEALQDMQYIDQCLAETLRLKPPGINAIRVVTEDYQVPGSSIVLRKGQNIIIPVYAIHYDPDYYPDPERYDPDRFTPEACETRTPFTYMPFGEGPKICIAYRLAKLQMRIVVATLLCSYQFDPLDETSEKQQSETYTVLKPNNGVYLKMSRIVK